MWRDGEGVNRKPQEQAAQLKGVFGEGASVLAVPDSVRSGERVQPDHGQDQALTPEQFQRKAQSRGLWDGGANKPPSQPTQPRAETLPRAVVGTATSAANTNFRNPSIGNEVSPPLPANLAAQQPTAAGKASLDAAAAANQAAANQRELELGLAETEDVRTGKPAREAREADPDVMDTMELDMAKFIQKGGLPQKVPAQAAQPAQPAAPQRAQPLPAAQPRAGQPAATQQEAQGTPPAVAAEAARTHAEAKAPAVTEKLATRRAPSATSSTVLIALIVVAALIAVMFIGAALGIWRLPWSSSAAAAAPVSLSKTVSAKSLPEMRTPALPPQQVIATAIAAPAAPEQEAEEPAAAAPSGDGVAAMAAEEAAPMHAAASSGGDPEDETDRPTTDVTEVLSAARAELRAGHAKEAEALLRPALEANPNDHHVAEVLAQTLIARGAGIEAVPLVQRIIKKRPKRASYRVLLGDALRRAGDEPNAKAAYREALALDPNLRDAHKRLSKMD